MGLFGKKETAPEPTIFDQVYLSISPQGEVPVSVALRPTSNSIRYAGGFRVQDSTIWFDRGDMQLYLAGLHMNIFLSHLMAHLGSRYHDAEVVEMLAAWGKVSSLNGKMPDKSPEDCAQEVVDSYVGNFESEEKFRSHVLFEAAQSLSSLYPESFNMVPIQNIDMGKVDAHIKSAYVHSNCHYFKKG